MDGFTTKLLKLSFPMLFLFGRLPENLERKTTPEFGEGQKFTQIHPDHVEIMKVENLDVIFTIRKVPPLPSLKLTASLTLKIGRNPIGK